MRKLTKCMLALIAAALLFATVAFSQQKNEDEVLYLPGLKDSLKFRHYAGYLTANSTNGRDLFYWFLESQRNPSKDPVVLWLNGGPGCSSLAGLTTEHGPFMINADGETLRINDYSWNKVANMLYLEAPAGVGYSYSKTPSDYVKYNDVITADDSYHFLLNFFAKYPEMADRDFYISGESFAGHYVPALAKRIHDGNLRREVQKINLRGILVGNGCTEVETDANSIPPYFAQHALIPLNAYNQGVKDCKGNFYRNQNDPQCARFLTSIWNGLDLVNPYYIYDSCPWTGFEFAKAMSKKYKFDTHNHPLFNLHRRRISRDMPPPGTEYDTPCVPDSSLIKYFNTPEVRKAIHATKPIASGEWEVCNMEINEAYDWTYDNMLPFYEALARYHILVFTGDVDAIVNTMGTQMGIDMLNRTIISDWQPWTVTGEHGGKLVGGFVRKFDNPDPRGSLTFATIRGGGHMVPLTKPLEALEMFKRFLDNHNCC